MKRTSTGYIEAAGAVFGVFLGSLLHFTYQLSGRLTLVGLFSAVNESPWEHLKLYFFPVLLFLFVEWLFVNDKSALLLAKLTQIVAGMVFIEAFFYTYTGAFGFENLWLDILSFVLAMVFGYALSYRMIRSGRTGCFPAWLSGLSIALILLVFLVTTFAPPHIPLFQDRNTSGYGIG